MPASASGRALGHALRRRQPIPARLLLCDGGREVSAYFDDAFIRVSKSERAEKEIGSTNRVQYRWKADGSWQGASLEVERMEAIRRRMGIPLERAQSLSLSGEPAGSR